MALITRTLLAHNLHKYTIELQRAFEDGWRVNPSTVARRSISNRFSVSLQKEIDAEVKSPLLPKLNSVEVENKETSQTIKQVEVDESEVGADPAVQVGEENTSKVAVDTEEDSEDREVVTPVVKATRKRTTKAKDGEAE